MRATRFGSARFPALYENFKNSQEIADAINRSPSYVKKALREGFTEREKKMLERYTGKELFT
jgi:predicted transcriptional regulator